MRAFSFVSGDYSLYGDVNNDAGTSEIAEKGFYRAPLFPICNMMVLRCFPPIQLGGEFAFGIGTDAGDLFGKRFAADVIFAFIIVEPDESIGGTVLFGNDGGTELFGGGEDFLQMLFEIGDREEGVGVDGDFDF